MGRYISPLRAIVLRGHVWLAATLLPLAVRMFPLTRLVRLLKPARWLTPYAGLGSETISFVVRRRLANPRNMRRRACLREGLVLFHFLRLAGLDAVVHFAAYRPDEQADRMRAHCWVTLAGQAVTEPPNRPASTLFSYGD